MNGEYTELTAESTADAEIFQREKRQTLSKFQLFSVEPIDIMFYKLARRPMNEIHRLVGRNVLQTRSEA